MHCVVVFSLIVIHRPEGIYNDHISYPRHRYWFMATLCGSRGGCHHGVCQYKGKKNISCGKCFYERKRQIILRKKMFDNLHYFVCFWLHLWLAGVSLARIFGGYHREGNLERVHHFTLQIRTQGVRSEASYKNNWS